MDFISLIPLVGKLFDKIFPDKEKADEAKLKVLELQQNGMLAELNKDLQIQLAGLANVKAEAESQSWLTRSWRPITALTFVGLVVAYWFGWTAPNLTPAAVEKLFQIIEVCLGGYTVGRSVEQVAKVIAPAFAK